MRLSRSPRTKRRTRVVILVHCVGRGCGSWNVPRPEFWQGWESYTGDVQWHEPLSVCVK